MSGIPVDVRDALAIVVTGPLTSNRNFDNRLTVLLEKLGLRFRSNVANSPEILWRLTDAMLVNIVSVTSLVATIESE